ncbi:MAG TPA: glycosyltransferase, partial [Thermomicrobiales bacterium]|nr:glycosyltransferase [Thermomicrobiales bacterium]
MQQMIPIFIPSFNNPTYLRGMLDQLHARGLSNIIVVDNASTLPEMQALLESDLGVTVVRLDRNAGPRSIFLDDDNYALLPDLFCVTDPDLELNPGLPPDFLARLAGLTERFQIGKAGFSLDISDRESLRQETFDMGWDSRYTIWDWEQQFWVNPVGELDDLGTIYRATIDTTFSVYNKRYFRRDQYMDAVRVAGMFTCRHLPWYKEATIPRLEAETYRATSQYSCYPPEEPAADEASGETDEGGGDWQETPSLGEAILGVPARDVLVIVPTRSRPENAAAFAEAFVSNSRRSDLLFGLDEDDAHNYPRLPGVMYEVNPRLRLNGTLNLIAKKYMDRYEYIAFMGDDHRVRTPGWDELLVEAIVDVPHGIAYGNDLYQGANLPTAVLMKSSIIRRIGYMTPPQLTHLCLDDFWLDLGQSLGSIRYIDSVIIEHLHPSLGKANYDGSYLETNTNEMYERDLAALARYKNERFALDIALLQGNMTRLRLRPPYSETELRQIYATPHQH